MAELTATDGARSDSFGAAVDFGVISGGGFGKAIIGAPRHKNTRGDRVGAAYIFTLDGDTWTQTAELTPPLGKGGDFGAAVKLHSTDAFVGAPSDDLNGVVYFFKNTGHGWRMEQAIKDAGPFFSGFGSAISNETVHGILIGAPGAVGAPSSASVRGGAVYAYERSGGWTREQKLTAADASDGMAFGSSIAAAGNYAFIGAPGDKFDPVPGAVYVFSSYGGDWEQKQKLTPSESKADDRFGAAVARPAGFDLPSTLTFVAGAPGARDGKGSAYAYGATRLSLAVSAPASVTAGGSYVSEVIVNE